MRGSDGSVIPHDRVNDVVKPRTPRFAP